MPEACHLLVSRLLGMPAAPLFAEDCNSNDICELFIGNQRRSCNPYKISYYFSSLTDIYFPRLPGFRILLILNIGSRQTHFFFFLIQSLFFYYFFFPLQFYAEIFLLLCETSVEGSVLGIRN